MLKLQVSCAACGKVRTVDFALEHKDPKQRASLHWSIDEILHAYRHIVQYNGDNIDIYCSKRCAA